MVSILIYSLAGGLAALLLLVLVILLTHVEDWSRDLSINWANTSANHPDERQRNIVATRPLVEMAAIVKAASQDLKNWEMLEEKSPADSPNSQQIHLVRTTGLMKYKDDIHIHLESNPAGVTTLTAESRSRIGKGDLGQNPRNLREILGAIRARL